MARKGSRVVGEQSMFSKRQSLQYHWADQGGRMYLCDCSKAFRVGDKIKHVHGNRYKRPGIQVERWLNRK